MKFEIGEIATTCNFTEKAHKNGAECEIVGIGVISNKGEACDYAIKYKDFPDHPTTGYWCINEYYLRKKRPPSEEASWEEVQKIIDRLTLRETA